MKQLLIQLREGNQDAFEKFFWLHNTHVYNFIFSLLHDKYLAEDLTQNVFLKLWEKHEFIDINKSIDSYLFTIARNLVYKETEMQLRQERLDENLEKEIVDTSMKVEEKIDLELFQAHFREVIEELPPMRREIFWLSRNDLLSYREIATRLSISEKTVENQISRAIKYLRKRLSMLSFILYFIVLNS